MGELVGHVHELLSDMQQEVHPLHLALTWFSRNDCL